MLLDGWGEWVNKIIWGKNVREYLPLYDDVNDTTNDHNDTTNDHNDTHQGFLVSAGLRNVKVLAAIGHAPFISVNAENYWG